MRIRRYQPGEEAAVWSVFFGATRNIVAREYTEEQVRQWAPRDQDMQDWALRLARTNPFVAVIRGQIVGFAELDANGQIDGFHCHYEFEREGVGTALLAAVEAEAARLHLHSVFAEVTLTGVPFFTAMGFQIEEERTDTIGGGPAKQFLVRKPLSQPEMHNLPQQSNDRDRQNCTTEDA